MGFGALLDYNLCSVPNALAYWILDNFNPYSRELQLQSGKRIRIVDKDVELTFGFPRGSINVERVEKQDDTTLMDEIAEIVKAPKGNVAPKKVDALLLKDKTGGSWFKKLFLIVMESVLIETSPCGSVNPKILHLDY